MEADRLGPCKTIENTAYTVLVDTNILILMAEGTVAPTHILEALSASYTLATCTQVVRELEFLASNALRLKTRRSAKSALRLLNMLVDCIIECPGEQADDALILEARGLASKGIRAVIATSDKGLRRRARSLGIPSLFYRESERRLEIEWEPL